MIKYSYSMILSVISCFSMVQARSLEKTLSVYVIEEKVNGIIFTHRSDLLNGKLNEIWAINGQEVTGQHYQEAILNAEREERARIRSQEEEKRKQEQKFHIETQCAILKKLIMLLHN